MKIKKMKISNILHFIIITFLFISFISLYQINKNKEEKIANLTSKLKEIQEEEQLVNSYKDDLITIKKLKQEMMGQENKIEEYQKQISEFTTFLIKNKEKLDELENN